MVTEDYVSFETAKLLKEKGFDIPCREHYYQYGELSPYPTEYNNWNSEEDYYSCPTLQMAMKWLRKIKHIECHIVMDELKQDNTKTYMYDIYSNSSDRNFNSIQKYGFGTYEHACETAIRYVLENLI